MNENNLLEELVNHVVKSTQQIILIDPETPIPTMGGSGCLINYKERLFLVSVLHGMNKVGKQAALDTGTGNENETNFILLPALNFLNQKDMEGIGILEPLLQKIQPLDICYTEIKDSIDIRQKLKQFGEIVVHPDSKRIVYSNLDYEPTSSEEYCFLGRIKNKSEGHSLQQTDKLVAGIKYEDKIGPFERFILDKDMVNELDYQETIGAPVFSETGELVALVVHGYLGENHLLGFSVRELKKFLDLYIDINPINTEWRTRGVSETSVQNIENDSAGTATGINNSSPKYITYSVLYGTNRKYESEADKIEYKNTRDTNLHIGTCEISIPLSHKKGDLERPGWFSSLFFDESPEKHFTLLNNELLDKIKFTHILQEKIGKSNQKDILLFIHGFNVNFQEAMLRTAQLGYDLNFKGAVTAFSWPSAGSVSGYLADTDTARLSSNYLCDFIKILLSSAGVKKLHIIAHSMGNVVLTTALVQLKNEGVFPNAIINQIILAAPDIDKDIFINQVMPYINRNFGLTLYASDKDKALISSKKIRKGFTRLGEGGDHIVIVDGLDTVDASRVDTSLLGHGYFADTQPLLNDIHLTLSGLPPNGRILDSKSKVVEGATKSYWII